MADKFKGLTKRENLAVEEFKDSLINEFPSRIKKIMLFGSKARGTASRASDIDLLVVVTKDGKKLEREIAILTHHPIAKYMVDISPLMVDEKFFKVWSPLLEHIKNEGIVLWTNKKAKSNM